MSTAFVVLIVFFSFLIARHWRRLRGASSVHKLPPGPPKLPLIGNLHQLIIGGSSSPLHHRITDLARKYGPVMHLQPGGMSIVVISSAESAKEVLRTKELSFAQRPQVFLTEIAAAQHSLVFSPYGDYWRQVRKICALELLNPSRVQSFRSIREEEVWNLVESISLSEGVAININQNMSYLTSCVTSRAAFGKKYKQQADFLPLLARLLRIGPVLNLPDLYPSLGFLRIFSIVKPVLKRLYNKVYKILSDIINEHRLKRNNNEDEDLVDVLLKLQESTQQIEIDLTDDCIKTVIMEIFSGGIDTSTTALEWAMTELIKNPRVMEKAQAEVRLALKGKTKVHEADIRNLDYMRLVIKETLRMHPPAPLQLREARENCQISGYEVPAKQKVMINAYLIGRDPNIWTQPECFRPERFQLCPIDYWGTDFEFIPFGAGRRICPGISFATATIELALAQLLYHFDWKLPNGMKPEELDMSEVISVTARKNHNLHLVPTIIVPFVR